MSGNTPNLFWKGLIVPFLVACALLVTGCQTTGVQEAKVATQLPPMPEPLDRTVGWTWKGLKNGKDFSYTLVSQTADTNNWEASSGCSWTTLKSDFSPALKWSSCPGFGDGYNTSHRTGTIWPLTVGKKWSYSLSGERVTGSSWTGTRDCEVAGTTTITTKTGKYDTYKVVCDTRWSTYTWYVSPRLKAAVYRNANRHSRGYQDDWETLEITQGKSAS